MKPWPHERDLKDYFDGKLEADLGLHGTGFEREGAGDPTAQSVPPHGKAARAAMQRVSAVLKRLNARNVWILAAYYIPIRPCDRNGFSPLPTFKETTAQFLYANILPPGEEQYSRVAMTTTKAKAEAKRVLGRPADTLAEVRDVVRSLHNGGGKEKKSVKKIADILEEARGLLKKAQADYDRAVEEIEVEVLMEKRRKFLEGL